MLAELADAAARSSRDLTTNADRVVTRLADNAHRRHALHRRGARHRRARARSGARTSARSSSASRPSCASCARRWRASARRPTRRRRRCATLSAQAPLLTPLLRHARAVQRGVAARVPHARRRPPTPAATTIPAARPRIAELARVRRAAARAGEQPRDHARAPRRPRLRGREGPALARRPGLHRLRGDPRSTSSASRRRRTSSTTTPTCSRSRRSWTTTARSTRTPSRRKDRELDQTAAPTLGPSQPGHRRAGPDGELAGSASRSTKTTTKRAATKERSATEPSARGAPGAAATAPRRRSGAPRAGGAERHAALADRAERHGSRRRPAAPLDISPAPRLPPRAMSRSARGASVFANPVLVGRGDLLVVNVAVFLAYNANQGLPFVPTQAAQGRARPTARTCCPATRSARAASASAIVARHEGAPAAGRQGRRARDAQDRQEELGASPSTRSVVDPAALGARPQVRRAHARATRSELFAGRRHDAASTRRASRSSSTSSTASSTSTTRAGARRNLQRLRRRVRDARARA